MKPPPQLLTREEEKLLLSRAEELWRDLQANNLGGFSGINRPFYIVFEFKRIIEELGNRDVGLTWTYEQLKALNQKES